MLFISLARIFSGENSQTVPAFSCSLNNLKACTDVPEELKTSEVSTDIENARIRLAEAYENITIDLKHKLVVGSI